MGGGGRHSYKSYPTTFINWKLRSPRINHSRDFLSKLGAVSITAITTLGRYFGNTAIYLLPFNKTFFLDAFDSITPVDPPPRRFLSIISSRGLDQKPKFVPCHGTNLARLILFPLRVQWKTDNAGGHISLEKSLVGTFSYFRPVAMETLSATSPPCFYHPLG